MVDWLESEKLQWTSYLHGDRDSENSGNRLVVKLTSFL